MKHYITGESYCDTNLKQHYVVHPIWIPLDRGPDTALVALLYYYAQHQWRHQPADIMEGIPDLPAHCGSRRSPAHSAIALGRLEFRYVACLGALCRPGPRHFCGTPATSMTHFACSTPRCSPMPTPPIASAMLAECPAALTITRHLDAPPAVPFSRLSCAYTYAQTAPRCT